MSRLHRFAPLFPLQQKPTALAWDSFDRANTTNTLGISDSGHTWLKTDTYMTFKISNNKAMKGSYNTANFPNVIDVGTPNYRVSVDWTYLFRGEGLYLHYVNNTNFIRIGNISNKFYSDIVVNNSVSALPNSNNISSISADIYKKNVKIVAEINGRDILVKMNNTILAQGTIPIGYFTTAIAESTKVGIGLAMSVTSATEMDNFLVEPL